VEEYKPINIKCNACQKDCTKLEIKTMTLKTCCTVKQIPLCRVCYEKYARRIKPKED
jgi:hypothetical protein